MTIINDLSQYNIREYAIEDVTNRHHFESPSYKDTLVGKTDTYESVFLHSEKIKEYGDEQAAEHGHFTLTGYKGKVAADNIPIDIDSHENQKLAQDAAIHIIQRLRDEYGVDPDSLSICFSGNKGFHIQIPAVVFGGFSPSKGLPQLARRIIEIVAGDQYNYLIDFSIYKHTGLIRLENTKHMKSGLYAIPLTLQELESLSLDEIRAMASSTRMDVKRTDTGCIYAIQKLIDLKNDLLVQLRTQSVVTADNNSDQSYHSREIKDWDKLPRHCKVIREIIEKSKRNEDIGHDDRVILGCVGTAFGANGKAKIHEILKDQKNYDKARTEDYLDTMADAAYKPSLCLNICGPDNLCSAIKAINKRSPIAFAYTHDPSKDEEKKYVESYAVDKITSHFSNLMYIASEKLFYEYGNGVYKRVDDEELKARIVAFLPYYFPKNAITNNRLNALTERIRLEPKIRTEEVLNSHKYMINLKNGMYDLITGHLCAHDMKYRSSIQLPFSYNPKATCPQFDTFMQQTFGKDQDVIDYVLKVMCYLLLPTYEFQKIWVWLGEGRNGKGVLSRLITHMIGKDNVSNEDIHCLAQERFSSINLKDKLANFSGELRADDLDMTQLKKLSGEDPISGEYKGKDKISFSNIARLICLANQLPRLSEVGIAITERFEIIRFKNVVKIPDTQLAAKLITELPGIFNRVISMFPQIQRAGGSIGFDAPTAVEKAKQEALVEFSSVIEFIETECTRQQHHQIALKDLYNYYQLWCDETGSKPVRRNKFAGILRSNCNLSVQRGAGNKMTVYGIVP